MTSWDMRATIGPGARVLNLERSSLAEISIRRTVDRKTRGRIYFASRFRFSRWEEKTGKRRGRRWDLVYRAWREWVKVRARSSRVYCALKCSPIVRRRRESAHGAENGRNNPWHSSLGSHLPPGSFEARLSLGVNLSRNVPPPVVPFECTQPGNNYGHDRRAGR